MTTTIRKEVSGKNSHRNPSRMYATGEEKKEIIKQCGDAACILYDYYLSKGNTKDFELTDRKSAAALGWQKEKAKRIRLKLQAKGWYSQDKFKSHATGNKMIVDYLGRHTVIEHKLKTAGRKKPITVEEAWKIIGPDLNSKTEDQLIHRLQQDGAIQKTEPSTPSAPSPDAVEDKQDTDDLFAEPKPAT